MRHAVTSSATVSTSTVTSTATAALADTRTTRPSGVRHDYLRRNPDRARHQQLTQNGPRQHQVHAPSRRLHNWRHVHTNFQSRERESYKFNSGAENHTSGVPHLQNFSSNHNFQATEQESLILVGPHRFKGMKMGFPYLHLKQTSNLKKTPFPRTQYCRMSHHLPMRTPYHMLSSCIFQGQK